MFQVARNEANKPFKLTPANAGDVRDASSIPGSGRSPGGGDGNPCQQSCLENPMDRGAWQATVYRVTKKVTKQPTRLYGDNYKRLLTSINGEQEWSSMNK